MREAHLRDFIAVIETGSVRAAARKLGLTQAAVSKNLTALERGLGVPLLVRSSQGVEPTEHGRVVLRRARVVDAELRKLQEELESLSGHVQGSVTVGLSATAESLLLPQALTRFRERSPGVLVSVLGGRSTNTIAALREGKIDFAIGPVPPSEDGADLHLERLCSSDLGFVVRAGHPLAHATELAQLAECGWVFAVRQASGEPAITGLFRERGLPEPHLVAHSDSSSALIAILLQSDLVSLTSLAALEPLLQQGMIQRLPLRCELPPVVQHMISSAARPLTAAAASLAAEFRRASRRLRR
jgi:DNA-binding transcriptional LysR family regulator